MSARKHEGDAVTPRELYEHLSEAQAKIDGVEDKLDERIDGVESKLDSRLGRVEKALIVVAIAVLSPKFGGPDLSHIAAAFIGL